MKRKLLVTIFTGLVLTSIVLSGCVQAGQTGELTPLATRPATEPVTEPAPPEFPEETLAPTTTGEAGVAPQGSPVGGYDDLVEALLATGAKVEQVGEVEQPFSEMPARVIRVNDADVQVFEFPDEATREAASAMISEDGSAVGPNMITWVDQPNFWASGRLLVLYVGKHAEIISLLTRVLGEPITEHETMSPSENLPEAVQAAVQKLSDTAKLAVDQIEIVSYERVEWRDGCLELSKPGQMCAQVITPGYRVTLTDGEKTYRVHTDESGRLVKIAQ